MLDISMDQKDKELRQGWEFVDQKTIDLERKIESVEEAVTTLRRSLLEESESPKSPPFTPGEFMRLYTAVYDLSFSPLDFTPLAYDYYKQVIVDFTNEAMLPALKQAEQDAIDVELMVREVAKLWLNHNCFVKWLVRIFQFLDRYFIPRKQLASLNQVGEASFHDVVDPRICSKAKDAALGLIHMEREGTQIDQSLLKNVILGMFVEMDLYEDFEEYFLRDTVAYYSGKASSWIVEDSCPEYMLKAEHCLKKEKDRLSQYLQGSCEEELMEKVRHELLMVYQYQLLEKPDSGFRALLKSDDKVEDLSRMYRLYSQFDAEGFGVGPLARMFKKYIIAETTAVAKKHLTAETIALVTAETIALAAKVKEGTRGANENALASTAQAFGREVMELHDRLTTYVVDCFGALSIFHGPLSDAFKALMNKGGATADHTIAVLLALFCDIILRNAGGMAQAFSNCCCCCIILRNAGGGKDKIKGDEVAVEDSLKKVVELLAYVRDADLEKFCKFYRNHLFDRIRLRRIQIDQERSMIEKLKLKCYMQPQLIVKIEWMLSDYETGRRRNPVLERLRQMLLGKNKSLIL